MYINGIIVIRADRWDFCQSVILEVAWTVLHIIYTCIAFKPTPLVFNLINTVVHLYNLGLFLQLCIIAECGELKEGDDWGIFPKDGSGDSHPDFPEDADIDLKDVSILD